VFDLHVNDIKLAYAIISLSPIYLSYRFGGWTAHNLSYVGNVADETNPRSKQIVQDCEDFH